MASVTSSSPSFASNSDVTQQTHHISHHQNVKPRDTSEETPAIIKHEKQKHKENPHSLFDPFADMDSKEYIERYNKIEADYRHHLMAKYFSDKDIFGESVFDGITIINGETIKTSRVHCAQSYADPVQYLKDKKSRSSAHAETQTSISNGKHYMKEEEK